MDNTAELTCAQGCRAGRVYVGAADGSVLAIAANGAGELPLTHARWGLRVCVQAVTSVCGVEAGEGALLLVGSADGELVVLREELEVRRFQLESAVQQICYDRDGEFIVGDALGNLYALTQYEILWKRRLPAFAARYDGGDAECFYPAVDQPSVRAIARAKLLDVEKTLSNYVLVATGQKHLLVTHRGKDFGVIPTRTPIATLASFSVGEEDVVLAAGEEGVIYRVVSYLDTVSKDMPNFRFAVEVWTHVSFPVAKLLPVKLPADAKPSEFTWVCLGTDGEVALFRGQEHVKHWNATSFSSTDEAEPAFPVDLTMVNGGDSDAKGAIVFPDRIHVFSVELTGP
ncbi:hypothetical protein PR003_g16955 [Phytophthora rubi]|uniref:Uncharacterized protein n=1 Tax=Phytophthora rubi TaxID=129364 RepID=A0A6A3J3J5_9STRA|nr:hypothetical protein PR002_g22180 [Phytophthora rubi]KAE8990022.1 hypothetical protein PR001_g21610 [Phytophthora rubi]KAE9323525.1 hypothetical protein PR003_g16955 [Phytophthora rubi]